MPSNLSFDMIESFFDSVVFDGDFTLDKHDL